MRSILAGPLFALLLFLPMTASRADLDTASLPASGVFELVVVEAEGCIFCRLFRRDVLPAYQTSEEGKEAPVRFIDVNDVDKAQADLTSPVDIVPTFVVLKSRHEVGRISGYVSPENFFHSINYLLASAP